MKWLQWLVRIIVALVVNHKAGAEDETKRIWRDREGPAGQYRQEEAGHIFPTVSLWRGCSSLVLLLWHGDHESNQMQEQGTQTSTTLYLDRCCWGSSSSVRRTRKNLHINNSASCERLSIRSVLRIEGGNRLCTDSWSFGGGSHGRSSAIAIAKLCNSAFLSNHLAYNTNNMCELTFK